MTRRALDHRVRESWEVLRDLLLGRYPGFVTGSPLPRGHVPVFVFHGVEPVSFERKLRYLADNGYVTLSAEEYFEVLMGARTAPERAVVLTFDDGRGSLWTVGFPLLKRYGMRAVVFLIPGRMDCRPGTLPPSWDDVRDGKAKPEEVLGRDDGERPLLSWNEVEAMSASGLMEFQSHTLHHARIHTRPVLCDFVTPSARRGADTIDVPLIHDGFRDLLAHEAPLGSPILFSESRTSDSLRFFESPESRRLCAERVAEGGGMRFFERPGWRRVLKRVLRRSPIRGRIENLEERETAIHWELCRAKTSIEERTGHEVLHLCYPWHVAGPTARRLAREAGYRTAFCGKLPGVPLTPPGGDPLAIARIGEDFLERLPGRGRTGLFDVLRLKWSRRWRRMVRVRGLISG